MIPPVMPRILAETATRISMKSTSPIIRSARPAVAFPLIPLGLLVFAGLALAWALPARAAEASAQRVHPQAASVGRAGPQPGDVFREYLWTHAGGDAGGSLRVGGRVGYGGGPVEFPHEFDLEHALRAEIILEKLLCHDGTRGLAISVNNHAWIDAPEASGIPEPQWEYMHHTYPVVAVPLTQLKAGGGNQVRLRVSDEHPWKWPQNLIYGIHTRIYYDAAKKPHPTGRLVSPQPDTALGTKFALEAAAQSPNGRIRQVDFLGHHEDVNLEGDGEYSQWHCHFHRAALTNHIGSVTSAPWRLVWDTSWVPDQPKPFRLAARVTDETGLTCFTEAVEGLTLQRDGLSVELCRPYDVPKQWLTRTGEKAQKFRVTGDLSQAVAAQLVWVSWSPGYMEGLYLNDQRVLDREGPRYAYYLHRVPVSDLSLLKPGENTLRTGKTPLYDGKMVHGMELNWPGIMVLIQYRKSPAPSGFSEVSGSGGRGGLESPGPSREVERVDNPRSGRTSHRHRPTAIALP